MAIATALNKFFNRGEINGAASCQAFGRNVIPRVIASNPCQEKSFFDSAKQLRMK
jgi:hypothetical protein